MKRFSMYAMAMMVVMALVLSACASSGSQGTATPGGTQLGLGETQATMTTATDQATQPVATAEPTQPATTSSSAPSMEPSQTPSGTEVLPSTGFVDPGRGSNLLDFEVYDKNNENVGRVGDLVLSLDKVKVDYVVVDVGGVAGIGSKQVPVPWDQLELKAASAGSSQGQSSNDSGQASNGSEPQNVFILKVSKDELDQAPAIDVTSIPEPGQPADNWDADIQSFWSGNPSAGATETTTPQATAAPQTTQAPSSTGTASAPAMSEPLQGVALASRLIGFSIQGQNNQQLVSVADIIIDDQTGDLKYVVVDASGVDDLGDVLIPIPFKALGRDPGNQAITIAVDQQVLVGAPNFQKGDFPDTTEPDWDAQIQSYWQGNLPAQS